MSWARSTWRGRLRAHVARAFCGLSKEPLGTAGIITLFGRNLGLLCQPIFGVMMSQSYSAKEKGAPSEEGRSGQGGISSANKREPEGSVHWSRFPLTSRCCVPRTSLRIARGDNSLQHRRVGTALVIRPGCGSRIRTCDLRVMSPSGWPLPHPARAPSRTCSLVNHLVSGS